ncbi:MAG: phosphate signaling complex protein PhoU [Betaproteobacteria bacterium]|nr:phosphate signaling complex protein PhoU [Betaproteobacteria bacterium]
MNDHVSKQYDQDLGAIRSRMMQMGGLVEAQVRAAVDGHLGGEIARLDAVVANDRKANELEIAIDNDLGQIIVRRQPAASDLRLILAMSKTVTDLERIGDEAAKIARAAREIHSGHVVTGIPLTAVAHVSEIAIGMLRRSLDAFARLDAAAASRVIAEDAAIDSEFRSILRELITFMMEDPRTISISLNILWIAKAFERIGDHAKNIAENVIYVAKGRDVRHIPLEELEREARS